MLLLVAAQEQEWDDIHDAVRRFQGANMALKHAAKPVVVAPQGMALGGGCEVCLHGARIQAAAETYMGLVETGVGLIPAGGGSKEMSTPPAANPWTSSTLLSPCSKPWLWPKFPAAPKMHETSDFSVRPISFP
jgi:hypothetical protein